MGKRVQIDQPAPNFTLTDANVQQVSLSDFKSQRNILLGFNRGFV